MLPFSTLWAGQTVSAIGSSLTAFALGVWVYQKSGSVTQFALIYLLAPLPSPARRTGRVLAVIAIALVAVGRVALRAHWPSDAIAGVALGLMLASAAQLIAGAPGFGRSALRPIASEPTRPPP